VPSYDNDWVLFGYLIVQKQIKSKYDRNHNQYLYIYIYIYITVEMDRITSTEVVSDFRRYVYTFFLFNYTGRQIDMQSIYIYIYYNKYDTEYSKYYSGNGHLNYEYRSCK
jgi:hypothetical protein